MTLRRSINRSTTAPLRWFGRASALGCVVLLALIGVLIASTSRAEASSCAVPGAGEIRVVLVVDATDIGGGSSATCLSVPAGTTGSQLLARRASSLGSASPRYGSSGLLCAIDGLPGSGCGDRNSGSFEYWAYFFEDSGRWVYGNINPFTRRLSDGDIEGWRFVSGAGNAQDPPPRIAPSSSLFPVLVPSGPNLEGSQSVEGNTANGAGGAGSLSADAGPNSTEPSSSNPVPGESVSTQSSGTPSEESVVVGDVALAASTSTSTSTSNRSSLGRWISVIAASMLVLVMAGGAWIRTRRSR